MLFLFQFLQRNQWSAIVMAKNFWCTKSDHTRSNKTLSSNAKSVGVSATSTWCCCCYCCCYWVTIDHGKSDELGSGPNWKKIARFKRLENSSFYFQNDLAFLGRIGKPSLSEFLEIYWVTFECCFLRLSSFRALHGSGQAEIT